MNEAEFHRFKEKIDQRESPLDGSCKYERVFGMFPRHLMEKCQLMNWAGRKGKNRIVIEYNNDTGEGWKRVVSEDPEGAATHRCKTECQELKRLTNEERKSMGEQKETWNHNRKLWEQEIKDGETLSGTFCMKTELLEKLIVLGRVVMGDFEKAMTQNKSFRCEMFYDAKAQVVDYAFFTKPEGYANYTHPESEE